MRNLQKMGIFEIFKWNCFTAGLKKAGSINKFIKIKE